MICTYSSVQKFISEINLPTVLPYVTLRLAPATHRVPYTRSNYHRTHQTFRLESTCHFSPRRPAVSQQYRVQG